MVGAELVGCQDSQQNKWVVKHCCWQTLKILEHDSWDTFGTEEMYRRTSHMPQQEQEVSEGINPLNAELNPSAIYWHY